VVLLVVATCSVVVGFRLFGGSCYHHLQVSERIRVSLQLAVSQSVRPSWRQALAGTHDKILVVVKTVTLSLSFLCHWASSLSREPVCLVIGHGPCPCQAISTYAHFDTFLPSGLTKVNIVIGGV
jgi:hypothetical protein